MRQKISFFLLLSLLAASQENLLDNPGFEELSAPRKLKHWHFISWNTNGQGELTNNKPHSGKQCVLLSGETSKQRSAYRQLQALPEGTIAVKVGGWYRTEGSRSKRMVSYRVHYHSKANAFSEIGLQQVFFPASETWKEAEPKFFLLPKNAKAVELQVFHWFTVGKTYWDDVYIQPLGEIDMREFSNHYAGLIGIDRPIEAGRNIPYSPEEGEIVKTNPPPFRWTPVRDTAKSFCRDGGIRYSLQISQDNTFPPEKTISRSHYEWRAEMLENELEPGTWFWRYGLETETSMGIVWSKIRRFEVTGEAASWPYPAPEKFQISQQRPRLFITAAELPEFRRRAAEGDLKKTADRLKAQVKKYAGKELVPEPDWLPKDRKLRGAAYTLCFRATRPPMDKMEQSALAYLLTADPACGAEAKRRVLHFFSWDPHGPTNVFHNDEPAMWVMMRGSRAYDWTYDLYTPEERAKVEESMLERARDFYKQLSGMPFDNRPYVSHPGRTIGFLGEAAISFSPEHAEARKWLQYITRIYWGVYPAWGKEDGGWNEGPGYWGAYMSFGLHFITALKQATGINVTQRPFFHNTPYYRLYLTPPGSQMSPFGDGTQFKPSNVGSLMYWFSSLNQDPVLRWYAKAMRRDGGGNIMGIVLKDDKLEAKAPLGLEPSRYFDGIGLAVLRTDLIDRGNDVGFIMRSSPYGAVSHGHNDQNCFVLEAYGEALAIATGHYNRYSSPHHANWTRQTKAKCGITYDGGKSQNRGWDARGKITDYHHGKTFNLVCGDATEAYGGVLERAIREVVHIQPNIFIIRDDLAANEAHVYEYWLHALDEMKLDADQVLIQRPKASLLVKFLEPAAPAMTQTDQFDPPVTWPPNKKHVNNWHTTIAQPNAQKEATFLSALVASKTGTEKDQPTITKITGENCFGAQLVWADGRKTIVGFAQPGSAGPYELAGIRGESTIFAVSFNADGKIVDSFARGKASLRINSQTVK